MAPLPANNTARVFLDYVTGSAPTSQEHTVAFRVASSQTPEAAQGLIAPFFTAISGASLAAGWRFVRARYQAEGSNFSLPVLLIPALAGITGTGAAFASAASEAVEWTWQGRSQSTGRRVDLSLYGIITGIPQNFRVVVGSGGAPAWLAPSVNALNGGTTEVLAIDGTEAVWYQYANANYNSYWERRLRSV